MSLIFSFNHKKSYGKRISLTDKGIFLKGDNNCLVMLIHGLTGTPNEMKLLASFLNRRGYSVICPRLANHGQPLNILKESRWQDFYESAKQAYLEVRDGYRFVFTGGLSMGALLALLLSEEFEGKIAAVNCLSPTLFYDGWNTPWYGGLIPVAYLTPLKHVCYYKEDPPYGLKNKEMRRLVHNYYSNAKMYDIDKVADYGYPYFPVSLLYQLRLLVKHLNRRLKNVRTPVQLIQAEEDDMTSVKNSQFIYNKVRSVIKEMVLLHDSYHMITADQERNTVASRMEEFYKKIRKGEEN
jgi:carboxylesterase